MFVSVGKLHDYALSNMNDDGTIANRGSLSTQFDIVTAQTCTERVRQDQERPDSDRLPTKKELRRLMRGVEAKLAEMATKNTSTFNYADYLAYAKFIIVRIGFYNLRRSGEVAAMSLKQFEERTKGKEAGGGFIEI